MYIKSVKSKYKFEKFDVTVIKNKTDQNAPEKCYNFKQNKGFLKRFHNKCNCKRIKNL